MNIRRGLFRLWIIFAVLFAATMLVIAVFMFRETSAELAREQSVDALYFPSFIPGDRPRPWIVFGLLTLTGIGIPAAVLGVGRALVWAADGFRDKGR